MASFLISYTASSQGRPNFIIFIADDVSWNDLGCYGNPFVKTPNIDRLAQQSIRFNNAYLTASSCSPSRNSIMTGRYPHNSGAAELHTEPPVEMISFPEVLRNQGYHSVQAGKFHMGEYAERGFDVMFRTREEIGDGGELSWVRSVKERPKEKPFFMWFAALDAHRAWGPNAFSGTHRAESLTPPFYLADGPETHKDLAQYYDEIARFDFYIGEVVKELEAQGVLENTFIIIMADNGRPFPHSKTRVNDRGMKTPFLVYWPQQIKQEQVSHSLVSSIDIAPTILSLAGAAIPNAVQGVSFEKLIDDPQQPFRNYVFAEHNWHDYEAHERMARSEQFLYIYNARPMQPQMGPADAVGSPSHAELNALRASDQLTAIQADIFIIPRPVEELYHLKTDSLQLVNIVSHPHYQQGLQQMRKVLKDWKEQTGDSTPEQLTPDWYTREPGYVKSRTHGVRGEMPGSTKEAVSINEKGPF
jgi:arylsulfatase A-like enzyme